MSKARLHPTVLDFRGAMGTMLFRRRNGKLFASIKSPGTEKEPTEAQTVHRERFTRQWRMQNAPWNGSKVS